MKVGRNDSCPCGSGKKYKKCCMNSDVSKNLNIEFGELLNEISEDETDEHLVHNMVDIFNKYVFFDLCRAVFCVNSWRGNRPNLCFYLSLNKALVKCNKLGEGAISNYSEFRKFFMEIKVLYVHDCYVDANVPDFGDVWIYLNQKVHPVFLGTGHNYVYAQMQCLNAISRCLDCERDVVDVLEYVKIMIAALRAENIYDENECFGDLYLPSENYCASVFDYYANYSELSNGLKNLINKDNMSIKIVHFIEHNGDFYPLFNPSIIIDLISILLGKAEFSLNEIAVVSICDVLIKNYFLDPESNNIIVNIGIVDDEEKHTLVENQIIGLAVLSNNSLLIMMDHENYHGKNLDAFIEKINRIHQNGNLKLLRYVDDMHGDIMHIDNSVEMEIVIYHSILDINSSYVYASNRKSKCYNLLDLIYFFERTESFSDLIKFFAYNKDKQESSFGCDGESGFFEIWTLQNGIMSQGSNNYDIVNYELNAPEWHMFEFYRAISSWYPVADDCYVFQNPNAWIEKEKVCGFRMLYSKNVVGFRGGFRRVGESYVFCTENLNFYDNSQDYEDVVECEKAIQELLYRNLIIFENELLIAGLYKYKGVQISYMPFRHAEQLDGDSFIKKENKYVSSDSIVYDGKLNIRFTVDLKSFVVDLENAKDKSVECRFMVELLSCVSGIDTNYISNKIQSCAMGKKTVAIRSMELDYYYNKHNYSIEQNNKAFILAKKDIAICCRNEKIKTGRYMGQQATEVIRKMQKAIIAKFESEIEKYDRNNLHNQLLCQLAINTHDKKTMFKSFDLLYDREMDIDVQMEVKENIIESRENAKNQIQNVLYSIDVNLSINNNYGGKIATNQEMGYILAYADWLMVLQSVADTSYYNLNNNTTIEVASDFRVSTIVDEDDDNIENVILTRIYDNINYLPKEIDHKAEFKKAEAAFLLDTGVSMKCLLSVCKYLALEGVYLFREKEILANVFSVKKTELIDDFYSIMLEQDNYSKSEITKTFEYLEIEILKIKEINGNKYEVVPIWEREKRIHRFEVRPLLLRGDEYVFSPVVCHELYIRWRSGLDQFYPPYELGLPKFCKALKDWKSQCERQMEYDMAKYLGEFQYLTAKGFDFAKRDKKANHNCNLGDYDVIAVDSVNKIIWNIECKFLQYVGSVKEFVNHQKTFFMSDAKDEKFQKRIDYLNCHVEDLLRIFKVEDNHKDYCVRSYMVTNKVFSSFFKDICFDIVTFSEFKDMLEHE